MAVNTRKMVGVLLSLCILLVRRCPAVSGSVGASPEEALARTADNAIINVMDYGAVGDGKADDTLAIRHALAIAARSRCPSTTVLLPVGRTFLTGPFNLTTDNLTLRVDGTIRAFSGYDLPADRGRRYIQNEWPRLPPLPSYNNSEDGRYLQHQAVVYGRSLRNVRITGRGEVQGGGSYWWDHQYNHTLIPAGRPNIIQLVNCTGVEIDSITLRDSPFWTVHPVMCRDVHIHHTTIRSRMYAANVDGIDPDSCRNVLIEHNDLSVGDDHVAIKSGRCGQTDAMSPNDCRSAEYINRNGPYVAQNITVRNNIFRIGMGIAIGSETSGSIRDVDIYDNIVGLCNHGHCNDTCCGWGPALHIKTTPFRGGIIENVSFRNNIIYNNTMFILMELNYQTNQGEIPTTYPPTLVRNISYVGNRALGEAKGSSFVCLKKDACEDVRLINNTVVEAGTSGDDIWGCQYIHTYRAKGNTQQDRLVRCMKESMNPRFHWAADELPASTVNK